MSVYSSSSSVPTSGVEPVMLRAVPKGSGQGSTVSTPHTDQRLGLARGRRSEPKTLELKVLWTQHPRLLRNSTTASLHSALQVTGGNGPHKSRISLPLFSCDARRQSLSSLEAQTVLKTRPMCEKSQVSVKVVRIRPQLLLQRVLRVESAAGVSMLSLVMIAAEALPQLIVISSKISPTCSSEHEPMVPRRWREWRSLGPGPCWAIT